MHLLVLLGAEELVETVGLKQLAQRVFGLFFFLLLIEITKFVGVFARPTKVTLCLFLVFFICITGLLYLQQGLGLALLSLRQRRGLLVLGKLRILLVLIADCVFL